MKEEKCPYCGSKEFIEAKQEGYAEVRPTNKTLTFKSQILYHIICLNCGTVIKSYVKNPKRLVTKNN